MKTGDESTPLSDDGRRRRWDAHRVQRKRELVKLAIGALDSLGPCASMEDIAASAGTSKSVFYRYFEDKAGLQEAVSDRVLRHVRREVIAAAEEESDALEALRRMLGSYLEIIDRSPNVYAFVTQDVTSEGIRGFFATITQLMASSLDAVVAELNIPESARETTVAYWPRAGIGLIHAATERWLYESRETRPTLTEMRDVITGWLAFGLAAPAPSIQNSPHRSFSS